jgi:phage tail sheath protein FI
VFEQNNQITRDRFLTTVNSYLNQVQLQQGLDDFDVIMDETNNTPNVIDNNQLVGQVYIKPTRSAEFILLEFNILPSSATLGG